MNKHMEHGQSAARHKNHITIDIGAERFWISLVSYSGPHDYGEAELALVHMTRGQSLIGLDRFECVRLNKWFDSACTDDELTVDLSGDPTRRYHLLNNADDGTILAEAIKRAKKYATEMENN